MSINFKKKVDIVPYLFDQEFNNLKHMELSATMWIDPIAILQPWPEEENRLHVATRPFQLTVCKIIYKLNQRESKLNK